MQSNAISKIAIILVCIVAALWITLDLFTSGTNVVARLYGYLTVCCGVVGLLAPRGAFYMVVFMTAYLDFFKRFMILDSNVSKMDLYLVMGMGPATMAGLCSNLLYRSAIGQVLIPRRLRRVVVITSAVTMTVTAVLLLSASGGGGGSRAAGDAVNATVYFGLFFVLPILFPRAGDLHKLLYHVMLIYVPAVLYMLVHAYRANVMDLNPPIFWWELDYVRSGLTIEIRQLAGPRFRPFGTMGNAASVSFVFACFWVILLSSMWKWSTGDPPKYQGLKPVRFVWSLFVLLAVIATFNRTGWVCGVAALLASYFFRSRLLTMAGYIIGTGALVLTIALAPYLLKHKILWKYSQVLYAELGTDQGAMVGNLATFDDRLKGFEVWANPNAWHPFGLWIKGEQGKRIMSEFSYHDVLTGVLLRIGYVPLFLVIVLLFWILARLHGFLFALPAGRDKYMGTTCMACGMLLIATAAATTAAAFIQYPINFFMSFFLAIPFSLKLQADILRDQAPATSPGNVADSSESPSSPLPRPIPFGKPARAQLL